MMKKRPILLCALLAAGILLASALLFAGCSSEIRIEATGTATGTGWKSLPPWLLQYAPLIHPSTETLPTGPLPSGTLPNVSRPKTSGGYKPPIITERYPTDPLPPDSSDVMPALLAHSSESATSRAGQLGWELLDGYVVPPVGQEDAYRALFNRFNFLSTDLFGERGGTISVSFDRPVWICGIELVFESGRISYDFQAQFDDLRLDLLYHANSLQQKNIPESDGILYMDQNTVWIESTGGLPILRNQSGDGALSPIDISVNYGIFTNRLVQINFYGWSDTVPNTSWLPTNLPDNWETDFNIYDDCVTVSYYNEYGEYVGEFTRYYPGREPGLPSGITRNFDLGGINATQVIHPNSPELIDLYWSNDSGLYNLSGSHPDLLQLIIRSMGG